MKATSRDELQERLPQQEAVVDETAASEGRDLLRRFDLAKPASGRARLLSPVGVGHEHNRE